MSAGTGSFTTWWADRYTRGLPTEIRDRRRDEITSDVFEQLQAASNASNATSMTWRTMRGIPSDVAWRRQEMRAMHANSSEPRFPRLRNAWAVGTQRWFAPFAVLLIVFNLLFAWAVVTEDSAKMPGQAIGPVLLVLCAAAIASGLWMRWRAERAMARRGAADGERRRSPVANRTIAGLFAILGITLALLVVGVSSGSAAVFFTAMGFIGICALVFGGRAVVHALNSTDLAAKAGLADGLIIAGTFPALVMFWMVVPPILALIVIGGVLGTSPKVRPAA